MGKFKETKFAKGCIRLHNDLKKMTFREKVDHLWTYYKEYAFLFCLGLVILALGVTILINQTKQYAVGGMMVNITMKQEGVNYLTSEYHDELFGKDKSKIVELDKAYFGDFMDEEFGQDSYTQSMVLTARVSGAMIDYMILDEYALKYYITQEVYLDLRDVFSPEQLAALEEKKLVLYAMQEGQTERWPIAINIADLPFCKDNVTVGGPVYFALSGQLRSKEVCLDVWERINAWQPKDEKAPG